MNKIKLLHTAEFNAYDTIPLSDVQADVIYPKKTSGSLWD
jgi:hypothetical protein